MASGGAPRGSQVAHDSARLVATRSALAWRRRSASSSSISAAVQAPASGHCAFPSSQTVDVEAFVEKFLLGNDSVDTNIAKDSYNTNMSQWITWDTPTLE
jgi:hypothetical protein